MASVRSMPVQKARSPAPVTRMQRTSSSVRSAAHSAVSSARLSALKEFITSGRLSVTTATPSAMSTSRVSVVGMAVSLGLTRQASTAGSEVGAALVGEPELRGAEHRRKRPALGGGQSLGRSSAVDDGGEQDHGRPELLDGAGGLEQ